MRDDVNENDAWPDRPIALAKHNSNMLQDNSVNKHLPYFWFTGVLAALALGLAMGAFAMVQRNDQGLASELDRLEKRVNVSENHWRNDEVEIMNLRSEVTTLQKTQPR